MLENFRDMIKFLVEKALASEITSYVRLRKKFYADWKSRWGRLFHTLLPLSMFGYYINA